MTADDYNMNCKNDNIKFYSYIELHLIHFVIIKLDNNVRIRVCIII